jgi:hypothetical protein
VDLIKAIRDLSAERQKLDQIIEHLEELLKDRPKGPGKTRGRKSMDAKAREEVSRRMKKYWAERRESRTANPQREPQEKKGSKAVPISEQRALAATDF